MSCLPGRVSALVDGALAGAERAEAEAHLAQCESCRLQAAEEEKIRASLRGLPAPDLPAGFEKRVRRRLRREGAPRLARAARLLLPLAAVLVLGLWARGYAPFVAWELSRDHDHCFGKPRLPAEVWSAEPAVVAAWFAQRGTSLPALPASAGTLVLVGARRCPLPDISRVPHLYYASSRGRMSVFVVTHGVRLERPYAARSRGNAVALVRVGGSVVGIVGEDPDDVDAFVSSLRTSVAQLGPPAPGGARFRPPALSPS